MVVNNRWKMGQATYCLCGKCNETWLHVLQCSAPAPTAHRELCLSDFELKLKRTKTYPPLADFLYDIMETIAQSPVLFWLFTLYVYDMKVKQPDEITNE